MELVSLDIERFGCVGQASIEFKPGLNVLHGANEVGKSSVARAIRFALLLPPASASIEPWLQWSGGGNPVVALVFRVLRDSLAEYYRVRKVFGTSTASLQRSLDATTWTNRANGRDVEGQLRTLLQWGIPEPGGAKAPKGLPESFLARALLADQDDVSGIFEQNLEKDGVESGRALIGAALQAMAQDPLFKSVLEAAQARVDEAFTASGKPKRGANDPFKKMTDEVNNRLKECQEAEELADAGARLAQRVSDLQREALAAEVVLHDATQQRQALEQRSARQRVLAMAAAELSRGQELLDRVSEADKKTAAAVQVLADFEPRIPSLQATAEATRKAFEAETANAVATREKRKSELIQEQIGIMREQESLGTRKVTLELASGLREADARRKQGDALQEALKMLDCEIIALEAVEPWLELKGTRTSLEEAARNEKTAAALLEEVGKLRERAAKEWPMPSSALLPDSKRIEELRQLHNKLSIAEGKLDVGLSVEVRGAPSAAVSVDGGAIQVKSSPFSIEAEASARVELSGGVEVFVRGGHAADRDNAERLRSHWHETTAPLFATLQIVDLAALEKECRADADRKERAANLQREAEKVDARRAALGNPAAEMQRLGERITQLESRVEGVDAALVEAAASKQGARAREVLLTKTAERRSMSDSLATLRTQENGFRQRAMVDPAAATVADPDIEKTQVAAMELNLAKRGQKIAAELASLNSSPGAQQELESSALAAQQALDAAIAKVQAAKNEQSVSSALLQERRNAAAALDIEALKAAYRAAQDAGMHDGTAVDESDIAGARLSEEGARTRRDNALNELRIAEADLRASGGAAAEERRRDLEIALRRAHEKQAAVEDEYEAWKLLAQTLKEAERDQATHLGNMLAPDLAIRFTELAGQRYGGVALGPHLQFEAIAAGGGPRQLGSLSIGAREQLSTLFRLCLAEKLQTSLLLDDQLVQSDPARLRWFRRALRETVGKGVQIVVLTCRPDDYLEPMERPAPHVIDVAQVIRGAE